MDSNHTPSSRPRLLSPLNPSATPHPIIPTPTRRTPMGHPTSFPSPLSSNDSRFSSFPKSRFPPSHPTRCPSNSSLSSTSDILQTPTNPSLALRSNILNKLKSSHHVKISGSPTNPPYNMDLSTPPSLLAIMPRLQPIPPSPPIGLLNRRVGLSPELSSSLSIHMGKLDLNATTPSLASLFPYHPLNTPSATTPRRASALAREYGFGNDETNHSSPSSSAPDHH